MIKKLLILTILALLSISLYSPSVHAESVLQTEPGANTGGLWHVEEGNRAYVYMRYTDGSTVRETGSNSNLVYPYYDYSQYTYWHVGSENDFNFPNIGSKFDMISNPDPTVYDEFHVEIVPHMLTTQGPEPEWKSIAVYNEVVNDIKIELHDWADRPNTNYLYDYSYITLEVDGAEVLTSRNVNADVAAALGLPENPNFIDMTFGVRMYWEKSTVAAEIDPTDTTTTDDPWEALPETTGSPVNPIGDWGTVRDIMVDNQTVSFKIEYQGVTYPIMSFTVDGSLDFIDEANDVLYYSDPNTGDRMLYFNFGETLDSAILAARTFTTVNEWKGEALWNLTQNQIKVTNVLHVYHYIPEVDEDGNVYSYFYMPDVPMDELISVSAVLAYRYYNDGFLGIGELQPGETQYKTVAAVRGETSSVNPTWVETSYKTAYITGALTSVATVAGVVPGYGWAIAGAAFLVGGSLQAADVNEFFAYDVNQIQHVIPSVALTNEINNYILEQNGEASISVDSDKLYKLHLATLTDGDDVEILDDQSRVTQVVWETGGEIYVLEEDYIEDYWFGPGTEVPVDDTTFDLPSELVWAGVGIAGLFVFSKLDLGKKPGLTMIIIAIAAYILYQMGLI